MDLLGFVSDRGVNSPSVQISDSNGRILFRSGSDYTQYDRRGLLLRFWPVAGVVDLRCGRWHVCPGESGRVRSMGEYFGN